MFKFITIYYRNNVVAQCIGLNAYSKFNGKAFHKAGTLDKFEFTIICVLTTASYNAPCVVKIVIIYFVVVYVQR